MAAQPSAPSTRARGWVSSCQARASEAKPVRNQDLCPASVAGDAVRLVAGRRADQDDRLARVRALGSRVGPSPLTCGCGLERQAALMPLEVRMRATARWLRCSRSQMR